MENFLVLTALRLHGINILIIARNEAVAMLKEPVYYIIAAAAACLIYFSKDFTFFTLDWASGGDESYMRTMIREMGLATILLTSLFLGLMAASRSIYDEIARKTALTVLSKPVSRNDFILGKYFGIITGIIPLIMFLGLVLFIGIRVQSGIEVEEGVQPDILWDFIIFKGVYLMYLKAAVLIALSVMVSTRLPFLPNILIVMSAYVTCHLVNYINKGFQHIEGFFFYVLQLIYALFLNLENFNYFFHGDPSSAPGAGLLLLVTVYTIVYTAILLLLANISFSKRDLF